MTDIVSGTRANVKVKLYNPEDGQPSTGLAPLLTLVDPTGDQIEVGVMNAVDDEAGFYRQSALFDRHGEWSVVVSVPSPNEFVIERNVYIKASVIE